MAGLELRAENRKALYVPKGFPYGLQTLTDEAEIVYRISAFFAPDFGGRLACRHVSGLQAWRNGRRTSWNPRTNP
jgi:dTDP-4-dehydrorhamnose 3,5-epimerase-like enzyme